MALETATTINQLVATNPPDSDPKAQGAGQLRLIKGAIQGTWPNVAGAITPTHTELNYMAGVTSSVQGQLAAEIFARTAAVALKADKSGATFTGTVLLPAQGANPAEAARKDYVDAAAFASSLPGQAGNSGKLITTNGAAASWSAVKTLSGQSLLGSGDIATIIPYTLVTGTTQTAASGSAYALKNVAPTTLTLPASPAANAFVAVKVVNGLETNVIARNGQTIEDLAENMTMDSASASVKLQFINSSWRLV